MLLIGAELFCGMALLSSATTDNRGLPQRAPLANISSIGGITIGSTRDQDAIREVVEMRLRQAGIAIDPRLGTRLVVGVLREHSTTQSGLDCYSYIIETWFQEPVRCERVPNVVVQATTWSTLRTFRRFGEDAPTQTLVRAVESNLEDYLMVVSVDTPSYGRVSDPNGDSTKQ